MNDGPPVQQQSPRPKKRDVHGWIVLDKPVGMTSTHAVAVVKRTLNAKKAGHAGTLDPPPAFFPSPSARLPRRCRS